MAAAATNGVREGARIRGRRSEGPGVFGNTNTPLTYLLGPAWAKV